MCLKSCGEKEGGVGRGGRTQGVVCAANWDSLQISGRKELLGVVWGWRKVSTWEIEGGRT